MVNIRCTEGVQNTIYTALRLERERNHGKSEEVEKLLEDAIKAVMGASFEKR